MKHFGFIISMIFSSTTFAANFTPIANVSSVPAQKLAAVAAAIVEHKNIFGDAGTVSAYSFTRKALEQNAKTIMQLSFAKGGANTDDDQVDFQNQSVDKIVEFALYAVETEGPKNKVGFTTAASNLAVALHAVKADPSLKIFGSGHAYEDGVWQILYILDSTTHQILMVKIGFKGI